MRKAYVNHVSWYNYNVCIRLMAVEKTPNLTLNSRVFESNSLYVLFSVFYLKINLNTFIYGARLNVNWSICTSSHICLFKEGLVDICIIKNFLNQF